MVETATKQQDAVRQSLEGEVGQLRAQVDESSKQTQRATEVAE